MVGRRTRTGSWRFIGTHWTSPRSRSIARAIVTNPTILVCDEPTGNLDRALGGEILQLFSDLHRKMEKTIVMVSHDAKAKEFATRVIDLE